jgi:hypothetical protein
MIQTKAAMRPTKEPEMSTSHMTSSAVLTRRRTSLLIVTGLGALIAILAAVLILALTGANHSTPVPISHASVTTHCTHVYVRAEKSTLCVPGQAGTASAAASPLAKQIYVRQDKTDEQLP